MIGAELRGGEGRKTHPQPLDMPLGSIMISAKTTFPAISPPYSSRDEMRVELRKGRRGGRGVPRRSVVRDGEVGEGRGATERTIHQPFHLYYIPSRKLSCRPPRTRIPLLTLLLLARLDFQIQPAPLLILHESAQSPTQLQFTTVIG